MANFFSWLAHLFGGGSSPSTPPVPPAPVLPDIPPTVYGRLTVWGADGSLPDATGVLNPDDGSGAIASFSNTDGRITFVIDTKKATFAWGATLTISAAGYQSGVSRVVMGNVRDPASTLGLQAQLDQMANDDWPDLTLTRTVTLVPLRVRGHFLEYIGGARFTAIETSAFRDYERFLNGEDLTPVLRESQALGFNLRRVWLLNTSVGHIVPAEHPDFYDRLPDYLRLAASFGQHVELTAFTQTPLLMPNPDDQRLHWSRVLAACQIFNAGCEGSRVLVERVNENDHRSNGAPDNETIALPRPTGVLASNGSDCADAAPPLPTWDYALYHSNDLDEWQRKVGHNAMDVSESVGVPCLANENTRPDHDTSVMHHADAAAAAALLCAGACFHSESGKQSQLLSAADRLCAAAWTMGALSIPLIFQDGVYSHDTGREGPGILRAYSRTLADGRSCPVVVRA